MSISEVKKKLRNQMIQLRMGMDNSKKNIYDEKICLRLEQIIVESGCKVVHSYIPMNTEIDIKPLLQNLLEKGVTVVCPKTLPNRTLENRVLKSFDELEKGVMGTLHPKDQNVYLDKYDLIIVPGLAFDNKMFRLGYGGGYYDGFLNENINSNKIGIFYPFQKVASIPVETHDAKMDSVVYFPKL